MYPDFAIVLNYQLNGNADADFLVKTARDIGARAVMTNAQNDDFKVACAKYTILLANAENGIDLTSDNVIDAMVTNRKNVKATIINVPVANGSFSAATQEMLDTINNWMHQFGHAFNEGQPSALASSNGFILENRHANYQKYVFLQNPLPKKIVVEGLSEEPNRVEWIEHRIDLDFNYKDHKLTIKLIKPDDEFAWQVLRIQAHRPEDDILETKF